MKKSQLKRKTPLKKVSDKRAAESPFLYSTLRRSTLQRKAPKQTEKPQPKRRATLGAGKKTEEWDGARVELKLAFEAAGITTCEARLEGCWNDNALGFAHRLKRRNITTRSELMRVALVCNPCHDRLEILSERDMTAAVDALIAKRKRPVVVATENS